MTKRKSWRTPGHIRKTEALGMPQGTARNILVRNVLFSLACQVGSGVCFACSEPIESAEDMSLEHKKPWLHSTDPKTTYFDLKNIALSHKSCNRPHGNTQLRMRKTGEIGTAWCSNCKQFLDTDYFTKNKGKWHGLETYCITCRSKRRSTEAP